MEEETECACEIRIRRNVGVFFGFVEFFFLLFRRCVCVCVQSKLFETMMIHVYKSKIIESAKDSTAIVYTHIQ